jgi:hypothetical protein
VELHQHGGELGPQRTGRRAGVRPPVPRRGTVRLSNYGKVQKAELKSPHWPFVAPGRWGLANAASPKYSGDVTELYRITPKPRILWVRGRHDLVVSETAASCPGALGAAGIIPDWPGPGVFPPQPMLSQTRAVLNKYAAVGGVYQEVVIEETGHVPFIEKLHEFNEAFHPYLR